MGRWLPGTRGEQEVGNYCLMGLGFQFGKKKRSLEMDGGDGRTKSQIYLMPLIVTFYNG